MEILVIILVSFSLLTNIILFKKLKRLERGALYEKILIYSVLVKLMYHRSIELEDYESAQMISESEFAKNSDLNKF